MGDREDTEALAGEIETLLENELRDDLPADPAWLAVWVMDLVKPHVAARVAEALAPIQTVAHDFEEQAANCRVTYSERNPLRTSTPARAPREPEWLVRAAAFEQVSARLRAALPSPDPTEETP